MLNAPKNEGLCDNDLQFVVANVNISGVAMLQQREKYVVFLGARSSEIKSV